MNRIAWLVLVLLLSGCQLRSLHRMTVPRHYIAAGAGAGVATTRAARGDVDGQANVMYHYTPRVLYRVGGSLRTTPDFLDVGADLELDPLKFPVRVSAFAGYSVGYDGPDAGYAGGGLRYQFWSSRFRIPTNADPQWSLSVAVSYAARFTEQPDVLWSSLLFEYVPGVSE